MLEAGVRVRITASEPHGAMLDVGQVVAIVCERQEYESVYGCYVFDVTDYAGRRWVVTERDFALYEAVRRIARRRVLLRTVS